MKHIYSSIDVGSDAIKIVVCELYKNKLNLLAATCTKSDGIKKGMIYDFDLAKESLAKAVYEVEAMLGIKLKEVLVNVPSYNSEFHLVISKMDIEPTIDGDTAEIESSDISVSLKKAAYNRRDRTEEVVTTIPIDFKIDERVGVTQPLGIPARVLETRAICVTSPKKNIYSILTLMESVGLTVKDISISGIGDIYTFKNKDMDDKVGAIINIGSETTTISLYNKGVIVKNSIIALGGKNIDNDLSYIYKLNIDVAKRIKETFTFAHKRFAGTADIYEVANKQGENIKLNQLEASEVVSARLEEILKLARKEINMLTRREVDYILVTGGVANMSNFEALVTEALGKKAVVGNMKLIGVRNNRYSSAVGNIIYYISKLKLLGIRDTMLDEDEVFELSSNDREEGRGSESMLGKVFGYFFNE